MTMTVLYTMNECGLIVMVYGCGVFRQAQLLGVEPRAVGEHSGVAALGEQGVRGRAGGGLCGGLLEPHLQDHARHHLGTLLLRGRGRGQ